MKKFLFIFMLICIGCKASQGNNDKIMSNKTDKYSISKTNENDSIIRTWNISKTISFKIKYKNGTKTETESTTVCNICPIIIFKKDGLGILKNTNGKEYSFNWIIVNKKICFSFDKKGDEDSFFSSDKEFEFKVYYDSKNSFLELIESNKNYKYVLIGF